MFSYRTDIAECIIRNEIKDWFKKLINETFGADLQVRYLSRNDHFNIYTYIEFSGSENLIRQAVEFIISTSETLNYKLPWISENSYYIHCPAQEISIEKLQNWTESAPYIDNFFEKYNMIGITLTSIEKLQNWRESAPYFDYFFEKYNMIGITITMITFPPHLDDTLKMELDKRFKALSNPMPLFIMYPRMSTPLNLLSAHRPINILSVFHGAFLSFLSPEDILSLEIANKRQSDDSYHDIDLNCDIQKFLQNNFTLLNDKTDNVGAMSFRSNEVLTYFIHKYHSHFAKCFIPNILTANEIQSLTRTYHIELDYHQIIHIDFRPTNKAETTVDFCAIYHCDENRNEFYSYDPKYATQNYTISFNADNSLGRLECASEFTTFVIKSQSSASPQKLNSIIRYVTEHFRPCQRNSYLVLYDFDLNQVSKPIITSLVQMMRDGILLFREMNLSTKTLLEILDEADHNRIEFRKCCIKIGNVKILSNYSKLCELAFCDMDIDVKLFCVLKNIGRISIKNCQIMITSSDIPIDIKFSNDTMFSFLHTNFDTATLLRLLKYVQFIPEIHFANCTLTSCGVLDGNYFIFRNRIQFHNMIFDIQDLLQILEYCEIQNRITCVSCHYRHLNGSVYQSLSKPVKIYFFKTKFDFLVLHKILETLHESSVVFMAQSWISTNPTAFNKLTSIKIKCIILSECKIEMLTLCKMLRQISKNTAVHIDNCDLAPSLVISPDMTIDLPRIFFEKMRFTRHEFFAIFQLFKENSRVHFTKCEITTGIEDCPTISLPNKIVIRFRDMSIESQIAVPLLQTDNEILFDNCYLKFLNESYSRISSDAHVIFCNMTFEISIILKYLANYTSIWKTRFVRCEFTTTKSFWPNIEIRTNAILFEYMSFDLEVLVAIMERTSENTLFTINGCNIQQTKVFSIRPIKMQIICFENMTLEIETILCILRNFTNPERIYFTSCKILCSNPDELLNLKLKSKLVVFHNMSFDVQIVQIFLQKFSNETIICLNTCQMRLVHDIILPIVSVDIGRLVFVNINYSPELLQILQYINGQFIVEFHGELANEGIIEICTKTPVCGKRIVLATQICTKSFYFELFAEYFRQKALNLEMNIGVEYDLPTFIIPNFFIKSDDSGVVKHDWNEFKIKVVTVNDTSLKLEFLKNGRLIDLFYELNDLPDDSDVCVVDYF